MRILPFLFSLALFSAAFLSFSIQPVLGKMLLPMVGGAPSGWIVAMAFFQIALLAGYGISYALGRVNLWAHAAGLLALYGAGFLFLPPHLPAVIDETGISLAVMTALTKTILLPFLALTATTAALQRIFSNTTHATANDPYYLFVASNLGSFAGLLVYPFLLEPYTGLERQSVYWQAIYGVAVSLIVLACLLAWKFRRRVTQKTTTENAEPISWQQALRWTALAFIPCSLSIGVTMLITTDLGGLPLFWVMPLGLYLLTFILAFSSRSFLSTRNLQFAHVLAVMVVVVAFAVGWGYHPIRDLADFFWMATLLLGVFFVVAWSCHHLLAQSRPAPRHLTLYYFIIAFGGALAGFCHSFVIPFVFPWLVEFPVAMLLSLLFLPLLVARSRHQKWFVVACAVAVSILIAVALVRAGGYVLPGYAVLGVFGVFMILVVALTLYPRLLLLVGCVALVTGVTGRYAGQVQLQARNFFGPYAVYDTPKDGGYIRYLVHGNTLHGSQKTGADGKADKSGHIGYYMGDNPIGEALAMAQAKSLAVVGLGSGQMACYRQPMTIDFYEIDPDMQQVAEQYFTYLRDCPPRHVLIGDGRRMMATQQEIYDVVMLDAFTSDTVPLHLVTREAVQIYRQHLAKHGILLFHISNRYLKLAPPLAAVARAEGLQAYTKFYQPKKDADPTMAFASSWLAIPMDEREGRLLQAKGWKKSGDEAGEAWTDDRSSLLPAISLRTAY